MATPEELLNDAIQAMADLHDSMMPDDREENALVPPDALLRFVDAHARLMYERERLTASLDAERYRWLKDRLLGADFNWNESGTCALVFEWPKDSPVSANCDRTIDDAILKTPNAK